ncbi:MAG: hypothetical protein L0Z53_05000 [Acidobacteriales bacterium]|nr:hypothetical protein [Terriglobales bacterium]
MTFAARQAARFSILLITGFAASTAMAGITISSPTNGATVSPSVRVVASASSTRPITAMRIYVDHVSVYVVNSNSIDTTVTLAAGTRFMVVQAWDSGGAVFKAPLTINVSNTVVPKRVYSNIDQMTGWQHCDVCAGAGGQGPTTTYWMAQFQTTPSLDGSSIDFFLGGATPYAAALWWKQLGANDTVRFFTYEMDFFFTNLAAIQALEFDVNQSIGGKKYIFGTECNLKGNQQWRVWDYSLRWMSTGIPCTTQMMAPNKWHNLKWEFERTLSGKTRFIAVTLDGVRKVVERYGTPQPVSVRELNVAFQMDGNSTMTDYHVWVDRVKLTAW